MPAVFLALLLLVELGGGYGGASASGEVVGATLMEVELVVEAPAGVTVVAHIILPGEQQQTVAMAERDPGVYGTFVEIQRANAVVVFEQIGAEPSSPATLLELGLDPAVLGMVPDATTTTVPEASDTSQWGWLALAAAAAALALLALWVLIGGEEAEEAEAQPTDAPEEPA